MALPLEISNVPSIFWTADPGMLYATLFLAALSIAALIVSILSFTRTSHRKLWVVQSIRHGLALTNHTNEVAMHVMVTDADSPNSTWLLPQLGDRETIYVATSRPVAVDGLLVEWKRVSRSKTQRLFVRAPNRTTHKPSERLRRAWWALCDSPRLNKQQHSDPVRMRFTSEEPDHYEDLMETF